MNFRLSCLCLDYSCTGMPAVKLGPVRTNDLKSILIDTILPVQSFFIKLGRSIDALSTTSSIADFLAFEPTFDNSVFFDTYSPWDGLDHFDRSSILAASMPIPVKRRSETRSLRFRNLKSSSASKRLPPPRFKGSPIKHQSKSELPISSNIPLSNKDHS